MHIFETKIKSLKIKQVKKMKGYQFLINSSLLCVLLTCYYSEGRPFSKTSSSALPVSMGKYFVDCGSFPSIAAKPSVFPRRILSRQRSSVSSMIRRMSDSYTPAYTCLRAVKLEENPILSNGSKVVDGVIHYILDKSSLAKVTRAKLTVFIAVADGIGEDNRELGDIDVMGSVTTVFNGTRHFPLPRIEDEEDRKNTNLVDFNVTEMLRQASKQVINDENQLGDESENKVTVSFFLTRRCTNLEIPYCPKIFNTRIHTPSLRLFFI